jgi:hypothetical protein
MVEREAKPAQRIEPRQPRSFAAPSRDLAPMMRNPLAMMRGDLSPMRVFAGLLGRHGFGGGLGRGLFGFGFRHH